MSKMSSALSVGSSVVGGVEKAHSLSSTKGKFLSVGSKELMSASVGDSAGQALSISKKAPSVAVSIGSAGAKMAANVAVVATKAVLVATGAGAPVAMAFDAAEKAVSKVASKAMSKMEAGMEQGGNALKQGSSHASFSNTLQAMNQTKGQMEAPVQDVKQVASEVKEVGTVVASVAKDAAAPGGDKMGAEAFGNMESRAGQDMDVPPSFAAAGSEGKGGVASVGDPISLEQDGTGGPVYMDPASSKSPLRFVAEEGQNVVQENFAITMEGTRNGMSGLETSGEASSRVAEIRAEAQTSVQGAMNRVPFQEDLAVMETARHEAGGRAMSEAAAKNGLTEQDIKQHIIDKEMANPGASEYREQNQAYLNRVMNDPSTSGYERFYLSRGADAIAELKIEQAKSAASGILKGGVIPGLAESDSKIDLAAQVAAERLGGSNIAGVKADLLKGIQNQGPGTVEEANQRVAQRIDKTPGLSEEDKSAMFVRVNRLTQAKLNTPEANEGWKAMGDYLMTGGRGPVADNLTAKLLIQRAADAAKVQGSN